MIDARKISELPETNIMKDSSYMPIAQDGETRKISFADLKWLFKGDKGEPGEKGEKGDTGVSIDRITVEESDVDEGENKIIILKDNGQAVTFIIRNGSKGVTMRNRGTWESGVEYENGVTYLDIVYYPETGCSYVCNTSHTSGAILPTDTNYWTLLSLRGEKGDKGDKGEKGDTGAVATVVQNTGVSLDNVMSQKAVSDELSKLKSDLVAKSNVLSYEEIMATNIDLSGKVASASAIKTVDDKLQRGITSRVDADNTTRTFNLTTDVNYLLVNADGSLGVWFIGQCRYKRFMTKFIEGGWDGANISISDSTLTIQRKNTVSDGSFFTLIPLNTK